MSPRPWRAALVTAAVLALSWGCGRELEHFPREPAHDGGDLELPRVDAAVCDQAVPIRYQLVTHPPDVLLVVDKSGSMAWPLGAGATTKWEVMRSALRGIVSARAGSVHFGLMLYPAGSQCEAGTVDVGVGGGAASILTRLAAVVPDGGTPTHTTLAAARDHFRSIPANPNGRYVLLATDGEPNCGGPDPQAPTLSDSIDALQALWADGVTSYVLGFGSEIAGDPVTLQAMASAGGTPHYFAATSAAELSAALAEISTELAPPSCTIALASVPESLRKLAVFFDGVPVGWDHSQTTGWDYDPATNSITFYGPACAALRSGAVQEIQVDYGCGGPIIP